MTKNTTTVVLYYPKAAWAETDAARGMVTIEETWSLREPVNPTCLESPVIGRTRVASRRETLRRRGVGQQPEDLLTPAELLLSGAPLSAQLIGQNAWLAAMVRQIEEAGRRP
ncbi:hypothetical protein [Microbacterium panaciterrae]|uniref:Uncharacterized protein n=1 Tax=Microbacterium panaciterrae TaxID=985759 RepID=A0ABP8PBB2_9MICO